ncbi:MAG: hypothetical protein OXH16_07645 [Gemmatimonadetes bacterium]|nr:hypothetical protein [Gemmatimonadota bacterium]
MPLENLLKLIEKLQKRIDSHSDSLRQSEALTRYALIDPLLRELGWDTEDPDVVVPEYSSGGGRVDYALLAGSKPVMMVEAKRLGRSLGDGLKQAVNYALDETNIKARYFSVTDGVCWAIYDTNKPANDMLAASFDLNEKSATEVCLKVLALWRPAIISEHINAGQTPIVSSTTELNITESLITEEATVQSESTKGHSDIPVIETSTPQVDMLDKHAKEITELYDEINDKKPEDMKIVHAFGTELNKVEAVFEGPGWKKFVTDTCEVDYKTATRSRRIARMLTVEQAVEEGSINKAYLKCREIDANNKPTPIKDHSDTPVIETATSGPYVIQKLKSGTIKVKKDGEIISPTKPILRELAEKVNVDLFNSRGNTRSTRRLGSEVIKAINKNR